MYGTPVGAKRLSDLLYSFFVGVVQGISEWLPISSKTQVLFVSTYLFSLPFSVAFAFGLFMEGGSLVSAVIYFRKDVLLALRDRKLFTYLLVVTAVTAVIGTPLYVLSDRLLEASYNQGLPMVVLGSILILDGFYIRLSRSTTRLAGLAEMNLKHYIAIGLAQGLSALPGVSRSGMTVSTMLFMGVEPKSAFRLSYLAYIPASLGALGASILLSGPQVSSALAVIDTFGATVALATSAATGLVVISALLRFARHSGIYIVTMAIGLIAAGVGALTLLGVA
jgi:undecaprenyl-diphosphatase